MRPKGLFALVRGDKAAEQIAAIVSALFRNSHSSREFRKCGVGRRASTGTRATGRRRASPAGAIGAKDAPRLEMAIDRLPGRTPREKLQALEKLVSKR